jgi:hypothetical protein
VSATPADDFQICSVCRRTLLRGERVSDYVTDRGEPALVCPLCKDAAEAAGWLPAALAAARAQAPSGGRRLRLRERILRVQRQAGQRLGRSRSRRRAAESGRERRNGEVPQLEEQSTRTPERAARLALEFFNATEQPRKVAGLRRSLGEPQVCVHPLGTDSLAEITVAWELSWYRWEVLPSGQVRQIGRGDEIEELPEYARQWNATAGEEGLLRLNAPS